MPYALVKKQGCQLNCSGRSLFVIKSSLMCDPNGTGPFLRGCFFVQPPKALICKAKALRDKSERETVSPPATEVVTHFKTYSLIYPVLGKPKQITFVSLFLEVGPKDRPVSRGARSVQCFIFNLTTL